MPFLSYNLCFFNCWARALKSGTFRSFVLQFILMSSKSRCLACLGFFWPFLWSHYMLLWSEIQTDYCWAKDFLRGIHQHNKIEDCCRQISQLMQIQSYPNTDVRILLMFEDPCSRRTCQQQEWLLIRGSESLNSHFKLQNLWSKLSLGCVLSLISSQANSKQGCLVLCTWNHVAILSLRSMCMEVKCSSTPFCINFRLAMILPHFWWL